LPSFKARVSLSGKIGVAAEQINKKIGLNADMPLRQLVGATSVATKHDREINSEERP